MCDTLVHVFPGRVLFAKNSDREGDEPQLIERHPAQRHAPGAALRCSHLTIPQVASTHAVLLSRPSWSWGAEMGTNEHGVTVGNEAVFTRETVPQSGLTGMDLVRLALERAATAAEAVQVIVALHQQHGQGGRCGYRDRGFRYFSSFLIADPTTAFVLETAGRAWASEEVRGARSISNGLTIPGFAEAHSDFIKTRVSACRIRQARTQTSAAQASTLSDLAQALRDHGPGSGPSWPRYSWLRGGMESPCMHAGGLVVASQTTASWIAELHPDPARTRHFVTATSAPCLSIFKPLDFAPESAVPDGDLWHQHEQLHRLVIRDPMRLAPLFLPERDQLEQDFFDGKYLPEEAWRTARSRLAEWTARVQSQPLSTDTRPWWVRRYWQKRLPGTY